tara:strand:- start:526 stop:672 length:147 start_codon:yes stop_codon:yes gene_type:complete
MILKFPVITDEQKNQKRVIQQKREIEKQQIIIEKLKARLDEKLKQNGQ